MRGVLTLPTEKAEANAGTAIERQERLVTQGQVARGEPLGAISGADRKDAGFLLA
jgi:hypothetical protein